MFTSLQLLLNQIDFIASQSEVMEPARRVEVDASLARIENEIIRLAGLPIYHNESLVAHSGHISEVPAFRVENRIAYEVICLLWLTIHNDKLGIADHTKISHLSASGAEDRDTGLVIPRLLLRTHD